MKKVLIFTLISLSAAVLAGCSSAQQRIAECEATGVSPDACYQGEQTRQAAITTANMNAAYANARDAANGEGIWAKKSHQHH